jgi:hypothetical protein
MSDTERIERVRRHVETADRIAIDAESQLDTFGSVDPTTIADIRRDLAAIREDLREIAA